MKIFIELECNAKTNFIVNRHLKVDGFFDPAMLLDFLYSDEIANLKNITSGEYYIELKEVEYGTGIGKDSELGYEIIGVGKI